MQPAPTEWSCGYRGLRLFAAVAKGCITRAALKMTVVYFVGKINDELLPIAVRAQQQVCRQLLACNQAGDRHSSSVH